MAHALVGRAADTVHKDIHPNYRAAVMAWQDRAGRLHGNIGYTPGTIYHYWHGKKRDRQYQDRWEILTKNEFDPLAHLHRDWQGLWVLFPGHQSLREDLSLYFRSRNEDSVD